MQYLEQLNAEQKIAATTTEGPLLILAGAGTGKTKTLTSRVIHIINQKLAKPDEIMCVTFTNKAAEEMYSRILANFNDPIELPWLGTFHKIGRKILMPNAEMLGLYSNFSIATPKDCKRLIKEILEEFYPEIKPNQFNRALLKIIEYWKNEGLEYNDIDDEEYHKATHHLRHIESSYKLEAEDLANIYKKYQLNLIKCNTVDFGNMILLPVKLLEQNPEIRKIYQNKIKYILVDEYQDTNNAQEKLIQLLAIKDNNKPPNICCVGDDDQSIYAWRGARVEHITSFPERYKGARLIKLERNYRSTKPILDSANNLISNNKSRLEKKLYPDRIEQNPPQIFTPSYYECGDSFNLIISEIKNLLSKNIPAKEIAVLFRKRRELRIFESKLRENSINYVLVKDLSFFDRKVVKKLISYLQLIDNSQNDLAFKEIINYPPRFIGEKALKTINLLARDNNCSLFEAGLIATQHKKLNGKALKQLIQFYNLIAKWQDVAKTRPAITLFDIILYDIKYNEYLEKNSDYEEKDKKLVEEIKEILQGGQEQDLASRLQELHLDGNKSYQENNELSDPPIFVMTIHAAKGLEFEAVLTSVWDGYNLDAIPPLPIVTEEERRLAYVLITRAKRYLFLAPSRSYNSYNNFILKEIATSSHKSKYY